MKIFLDMDGVLTDFDKQFEKNDKGLTMRQYIDEYGVDAAWNYINYKQGEAFWSEMEWTKDGKELWEYLKPFNPIIISSPSRHASSKTGKRKWLERELGIKVNSVTKIGDFTKDINVVFTRNKYLFANLYPDSLLIDDYHKNTDKWPGRFILHKNATQTIFSLQ